MFGGGNKIKLEPDLLDRIKKVAEVAGYASHEEFIVHVLEKERNLVVLVPVAYHGLRLARRLVAVLQIHRRPTRVVAVLERRLVLGGRSVACVGRGFIRHTGRLRGRLR